LNKLEELVSPGISTWFWRVRIAYVLRLCSHHFFLLLDI
jgi:hypothetical protein